MATAPIYCTHKELKRVFPRINEFDTKRPVYGWESLGNNAYIAHDTGLITQLFQDGKELHPATSPKGTVGAGQSTYRANITHSLASGMTGEESAYNVFTYNASFPIGDEDDMQVGDYIGVHKTAAGTSIFDYCFIESINTGANQITVRRAALGTNSTGFIVTGDDLFFEFQLRVDTASQWYYDSYYNQALLYSTTNPADLLIEAGEDFTAVVTQFRTDASRYLDSRLDPNLPREQLKDKSGNFDYMIIRTTALIAASFMIKTNDATSEMAASFMEEAEKNIEDMNNGNSALSWQNTSDGSKGVIRDVTYTGTVRPVDTRGRWSGTYDLIKVKIDTTGGAIGTATYSVWVKDGDKLGMNEGTQVVTTEVINGDYQTLSGGLQIRFAGTNFDSTAAVNDTWEIEVTGFAEEVDSSSLKPIRMTRRWQ